MWTGSWTGSLDNPSAASAISAMICVIYAASAHGARGRTSHNPAVIGASPAAPLRSSQLRAPAFAVSRVEAHVLHADDLLAFVLGDGVPDGHVVGGQVQFGGAGQGVVAGNGSARAGTGSLADGRSCAGPSIAAAAAGPRFPARTSPGSGRGGHSRIPHASASSSRVNAGTSSPGPESA
jgi:hypothetical protein